MDKTAEIQDALTDYANRLANGLDTDDQEWRLRNLGYEI